MLWIACVACEQSNCPHYSDECMGCQLDMLGQMHTLLFPSCSLRRPSHHDAGLHSYVQRTMPESLRTGRADSGQEELVRIWKGVDLSLLQIHRRHVVLLHQASTPYLTR